VNAKLIAKVLWSSFGGMFAVLIIILVSASQFLVYIKPNQYGIKEVKLGVHRGIQPEVAKPGWEFVVPGFSRFHVFPSDIQVFDLSSRSEERAQFDGPIEKAAHIQTSDGFFVDVDVSILYRIVDPYLVITKIGPGNLFVQNGIAPRAEPILKQALGALDTEKFFNSNLRAARVAEAKELLNKETLPRGIAVDHVLIRYFSYSDEIQKNIEEKKLKDQLVFKNQSEARAAAAEAELMKVSQEGEAKLVVKLQEGTAYQTVKTAEQELYARKRRAEGDLLVQLAEAHRVNLKNAALQGAGSESMVGLKMADVFKGLDLLMLPSDGPSGVNPLDLDKTVKAIASTSQGALQ
jgi:regulator of protease activity HflC (stomatin/prohibitin superfamily)